MDRSLSNNILIKNIKNHPMKYKILKTAVADRIDLMTSQFIDIKDCQSVCLVLGPYRNLTTLTAATLFLHPNCQVLNHAGSRIFGKREVDFLSDYSPDKLDRFIKFAIKISAKGQKGNLGGSIAFSHAFDSRHNMKQVFAKTGARFVKKPVRSLFWKESLHTSNLIREKHVDLGSIIRKENRLRFLLPIRNPLDCAVSNLKTGHVRIFRGLKRDSSVFEVVQAVLDEILWFATYKEKFPARFFYYFEHDISRKMLINLATFLKLHPSEAWLSDALSVMTTTSKYEHNSKLVTFYRKTVKDRFSCFPALSEGLLTFM
jgi:hypothetical protein